MQNEMELKKCDPAITMFMGRSSEYPLELNLLINPLRCELCSAKFTSPSIALVHYSSNKHQKNIKSWMWKNCFIRECEVCKVKLNSLNDFTIHCSGRKHKRQIAGVRTMFPDYKDPADLFGPQSATTLNSISKRPSEDVQALEAEQQAKKAKIDMDSKISIYRTPSGSFYCKNCNITINDKNHFEGHLKSKRHLSALKS
ncbi:hypothetical protein ACFFRR_001990 [Megaselia abdita]